MKIPIQLHSQSAHPLSSLLTRTQSWLWIKAAFWQKELPHRKLTPAFVDTALLWSSFPWQPVQCLKKRKRFCSYQCLFSFSCILCVGSCCSLIWITLGKGTEAEPEIEKWTNFEGMGLFALFFYSCSIAERRCLWERPEFVLSASWSFSSTRHSLYSIGYILLKRRFDPWTPAPVLCPARYGNSGLMNNLGKEYHHITITILSFCHIFLIFLILLERWVSYRQRKEESSLLQRCFWH